MTLFYPSLLSDYLAVLKRYFPEIFIHLQAIEQSCRALEPSSELCCGSQTSAIPPFCQPQAAEEVLWRQQCHTHLEQQEGADTGV